MGLTRRTLANIARLVERHSVLSFSLFTVAYLAGAFGDALRKPFWFDELFSWHIARLGGFPEIFRTLSEGIDPNPPLSYSLILVSHKLFGAGELATRLPSIAAFWLALLFLFLLTTRRWGALFGITAVLSLSLTKAFAYATEARPYALLLACCAASFFFWQLASEKRGRPASLVCLSASLVVALLSHLYAVLLFVPLAAGELWRSLASRKVDRPVWVSIIAPFAALLVSVPMMLEFSSYSGAFWSQPTAGNLMSAVAVFYCNPLVVCLLAAGCLTGLAHSGTGGPSSGPDRPGLPPTHELVALTTLILLPLIGFVLARLATNAYYYRYFLPSAVGVSMAFAIMFGHTLRTRPAAAGLLFLGLTCLFLAGQAWRIEQAVAGSPLHAERVRVASKFAVEGENLIVVNEPRTFLEYLYYASPQLRGRLLFLVDLGAASRLTGQDTSDRALAGLRRKRPIPVEDYRVFTSSHKRFWVSGTDGWLLDELCRDGARLSVESRSGRLFIQVLMPESRAGPSRGAEAPKADRPH